MEILVDPTKYKLNPQTSRVTINGVIYFCRIKSVLFDRGQYRQYPLTNYHQPTLFLIGHQPLGRRIKPL